MFEFYYDESEHSRKLTHQTLTADNYYDGFVSAIVGWDEEDGPLIQERFEAFELRHAKRKHDGEIKSQSIKRDQIKYGFASLSKDNLLLLQDFLAIFDEHVYVYLCYQSKAEYMVQQLFGQYKNSRLLDMDLMRYSITKTIVSSQPDDVMASLHDSPSRFLDLLKSALYQRMKAAISNKPLKYLELCQFGQILLLLDSVEPIETFDWEYDIPFEGFTLYLGEMRIDDYRLIVDEDELTVKAARATLAKEVSGGDSKDYFGLRIADMFVGIVTKLMKSLHEELRYHSADEYTQKRLVSSKWFQIDQTRHSLYKKLSAILLQYNNASYKVFAGPYSDDLATLIALLKLIDSSAHEEIAAKARYYPEYLNALACEMLGEHFVRVMDKPDGISSPGTSLTVSHAPFLQLNEGARTLFVFAVGCDGLATPLILIDEGDAAITYRLPDGLKSWAFNLLQFADSKANPLPAQVRFTTVSGKHYVDIL